MRNVQICRQIKQSSSEASYMASIPNPFPPKGLFALDQITINKATQAERLIGKLDGITQTLPDIKI